jgi:multiple sugar transport system substrate-binding protein
VTRRTLLRTGAAGVGALAGGALLAACGASGSAVSTGAATTALAPTTTTAVSSVAPKTTASAAAAPTSSAAAAVQTASSTATSTSTSVVASVSAPGTKGVTLTYCSPDSPGRYAAENAIFDGFTKANPNISVQIVSPGASWTNVEEKLKTSIAAGTPLNFYQNGWGFWFDVEPALMDLTPLLARDKIDPMKAFVPSAVEFFTLNGKIWGLPLVGISVDALAYNQDLFDAAGLPHLPTNPDDPSFTMDKFLEYAQKLTKVDQLHFGFGGSVGGGEIDGIERPTYFGGAPWDDTSHKALLDQPPAIAGLQFFKDLRDKYQVQPNAQQVQAIGAPKGQNIFTSGKIGMQVIYGYIPKLTFTWAIAPLPHSASKNVSGRAYPQTLQATKTALSEQTWKLFTWLIIPTNAAHFPLSAHYAVSPVIGASDLAVQAYKDQVGVDPAAFQAMAEHAGLEAAGMYRYPGWNTVNKWMDDNFPNFDNGKESASDYGKTATAFINANLVKG